MSPDEIKEKIATVESALVFTKNNCGDCTSTIEMMISLNANHEVINIDENPDARAILKGMRYIGAPVVFTPDDKWSGFNPTAIRTYADGEDIWG